MNHIRNNWQIYITLVTIVFSSGIVFAKVNSLEGRVANIESVLMARPTVAVNHLIPSEDRKL